MAALISVAGVVVGVARFVEFVSQRVGGYVDADAVAVVRSTEDSADRFVRQLIGADGGAPLRFHHEIYGRRGPADVTVEYNCQPSGRCSTTRVQVPADQPADIDGGVWYWGCWTATRVGNGFGADPLDLQLCRQGSTCGR